MRIGVKVRLSKGTPLKTCNVIMISRFDLALVIYTACCSRLDFTAGELFSSLHAKKYCNIIKENIFHSMI